MERVCWYKRGEDCPISPYELNDHKDHTLSPVSLDIPDSMLEAAARLIVFSQQGSTSFVQRRFSIGYNGAGRLLDQLEALGVGGQPEDQLHVRYSLLTSIR